MQVMHPPVAVTEFQQDAGLVSPELRAEIRSRVYWLSPGRVYVKDIPNGNVHTLRVLCDRFFEVIADQEESVQVLVNLTEAERPAAQERALLRAFARASAFRVDGIAFATGKNVLLNVALKFVLHGAWPAYTVCRTDEEALAALDHARAHRHR